MDTVVATDAGCMPNSSCAASFDEFTAFAKCRHTYFKNWTTLEASKSLLTTTCNPTLGTDPRFTDNGTTVTDNLSGLVWEKKTNDASVHNEGNLYTWSTGALWNGDGTAFTTFLTGAGTGLNVAGFAGANDWRLPTLAELQTIVLDFPCTKLSCTCSVAPCIDGTFGPTQSFFYWPATSYVPLLPYGGAWVVSFQEGYVGNGLEVYDVYVRAVRGGW